MSLALDSLGLFWEYATIVLQDDVLHVARMPVLGETDVFVAIDVNTGAQIV